MQAIPRPDIAQTLLVRPGLMPLLKLLNKQPDYARIVGGSVRDALMGRAVGDIDIATVHVPEETMAILKAEGIKTIPTGLSHGTVTAIVEHTPYEITTLRVDEACDGRHAKVKFTSVWQEDAARRDFTFNALYMTPEGAIYDYFTGIEDITAQRIKFIGDPVQRIHEDHLRILRFYRFGTLFTTPQFDAASLAACSQHAHLLQSISAERIQHEMLKLLAAPHPETVLQVMAEKVLPSLGFPQIDLPLITLLTAWEQRYGVAPHPLRRLALLCLRAPNPAAFCETMAKRLRLSTKDKQHLQQSVTLAAKDMKTVRQWKSCLRKYGKELFLDSLLLYLLQAHAQQNMTSAECEAILTEAISFSATWPIPHFPLKGSDLLTFGIAAGPIMGKMLQAAESWWEREDYRPSKEELLLYIQKLK